MSTSPWSFSLNFQGIALATFGGSLYIPSLNPKDTGKGDEARSGAVNATDADTTVLGRGVGSSSLSTAYLAGGTILHEGRLIMRLRHWVGKNGVLKGPFIRGW